MFYDHPLLGLYFLGEASDGSNQRPVDLCRRRSLHCRLHYQMAPVLQPGNLNAASIFTGVLWNANCMPVMPALLPAEPAAIPVPEPATKSLFLNQNYLPIRQAPFAPAAFPLAFQPFGYPQAKNFVYAYSQQANLTIERDLGDGYAFSLAYNFNGGRHLNRPINANTIRGDLLVANWQAAYSDPTSNAAAGPLEVGTGAAPCGVNPNNGLPWVTPALTNFFRPGGINPSIADFLGAVATALV